MGLDVNQQAEAFDTSNTGKGIGTNDSNNVFDSTNVVSNADGSLMERMEDLKDKLSGVDSSTNVLGVDDADNGFASTNVVANDDGSVLERLEGILQRVSGVDGSTNVLGADDSDNAFASTNVAANRDGSLLERSEFSIQAADKALSNSAQTLSNGATLFTIANGPIAVLELMAYCTSNENSGGAATTLQWSHDPTDGAAAVFSGASASVASAVAGTTIVLQGTALSTAPTVSINGPVLGQTREIILQPGTITSTVASGPTTASFVHYLRYRPLSPAAVVS